MLSSAADGDAEQGGQASGNPDPTMKKLPGKPSGENVPPAGGESMAPADSDQPYAPPGGQGEDEG